MLQMIPSPLLPLAYKLFGHFAIFSVLTGGLIAVDVDFRNQVTLGSAIIAALILIIAGVFTARSKIATIWREEAEGERAAKERCQEELSEEKLSRVEFEKAQQEIRHNLKDEIAGLSAQLKVMEAKTDLTVALKSLHEIATAQQHGNDETHKILTQILNKLPEEPLLIKEMKDDG